jgi:fatty acid-binding protein DegV
VGGAQAWVGGALKITPIVTVDGEIKPVERVRTSVRAFDRMVGYLRTLHADGLDGWLVQHIQAPDQAQRLVDVGRELFGSEPLFVSEVGPVLGVLLGPGMIGVAGIPTSGLR